MRNRVSIARESNRYESVHATFRVLGRSPVEKALWLTVAFAALGDLGTTATGLRLGLVESNPVGHVILRRAGIWGMFVLKVFVIGIAILIARAVIRAPDRFVPDRATIVVPTGLAVVWLIAVIWNAALIAIVTL